MAGVVATAVAVATLVGVAGLVAKGVAVVVAGVVAVAGVATGTARALFSLPPHDSTNRMGIAASDARSPRVMKRA